MKLSNLLLSHAVKRFIRIAKWPFAITLVLSTLTAFTSETWSKILSSAIEGQLALTLIKLCFYVGLLLLPLAFVLHKWPKIFFPIHSVGDIVGGIGFDMSAGAAGVMLGFIGGLVVELPLLKAVFIASYLAFLFTSIAFLLWAAAVAPKQLIAIKDLWKLTLLFIGGILITSLAGAAMYCETWPEIKGLKLQQNEHVCKPFR